VSALLPIAAKFKTVDAVAGRMVKLDSRSVVSKFKDERLRQKDLRKRSLNFHKFLTEFPRESDVPIRALEEVERIRWLRRLPLQKLTSLIQDPENPSFEVLRSHIPFLSGTISKHFREISPAMYCDFARLIGEKIDFSDPRQDDLHVLDMFLRGIIHSSDDTPYTISQLGSALGYCRRRGICGCLKMRRRFLNLVAADQGTFSPIIKYFSNCSPDNLDDLDLRLLRILIRKTVTIFAQKKQSHSNLQTTFLGRLGLMSDALSPADIVATIRTLGLFASHLRLPRQLYDGMVWYIGHTCDLSLINRISLLAAFARDPSIARFLRSLLHQYFISSKNLSLVPREELETVSACCRQAGFEHPFHLRRLERSLPGVVRQQTSNDRFRELVVLLKFPKAHHVRHVRRRIHALMNSVNIGRVSSELVKADIAPHDACKICRSFSFRLDLARKFHLV
jgi:hypothetical protein